MYFQCRFSSSVHQQHCNVCCLSLDFFFCIGSLFYQEHESSKYNSKDQTPFWNTTQKNSQTFLAFSFKNQVHIFSCVTIGAYATILPFAFYFGSTLNYIVINAVAAMTVPGYAATVGYPPFQTCGESYLLFNH